MPDRLNPATSGRLITSLLIGLIISTQSLAGWETRWIDRFDGDSVNWDNWTAQVQANFNAELQCYTDDDSSVNRNFDVSNGVLKIIARRQSINCPGLGGDARDFTSGRLTSKDKGEFLFGRLESRIRFLNLEAGSWPAFWMLENRIFEDPIKGDNDTVSWPNPGAGEIDVWEWFANSPSTYITAFHNIENCAGVALYNYPGGAADVRQWHDYAIEWDQLKARFFIDDELVVEQNIAGCSQYKEPMFALLNVAIGGTLGGNVSNSLSSATMEIDYIAHCNASSANNATRCNETTPGASNIAQGGLAVFNSVERYDWTAWDCCGGSTPVRVIDSDSSYAEVMEFSINGNTLVGFTTRAPFALDGKPFDASTMADLGTIEFDLKMTTSPGPTTWKIKLESDGASTSAELDLSSSLEAHAAPELNVWQHYSFELSQFTAMGLDISAIDLVTVFPEWGTGDGAVYRIDNIIFRANELNAAPVITSTAVTSGVANQAYQYPMSATDANNDTLTYNALLLPSWLSFDVATTVLAGTPALADVGSHEVSLSVSDSIDSTIQNFTIEVAPPVNTVPVITSSTNGIATVGEVYQYQFMASDLDGDLLTLTAPSLPGWLNFDAAASFLSGTPDATDVGDHSVTLVASDGSDTASQNFTIRVSAPIPPPAPTPSGTPASSSGSGSAGVWLLLVLAGLGLSNRRLQRSFNIQR